MSKRNSYEIGFKLEVVKYTEKHGNRSSGRKFGVSEKLERGWRKGKVDLKEMPETKKAARFSISPYRNLEKELNDWILDIRKKGLIVNRFSIRTKALQRAPKYNIPQLKSSRGWCTRFMNRCSQTPRQRTRIVKKVAKDANKKIHKFVRKKREVFDCSPGNIVSMDETSIDFDMPGNTMIDRVGSEASFEIEIDNVEVDNTFQPHEMDQCVLIETLEKSATNENTLNFTEVLRRERRKPRAG